jgi:peroxiredoxin
MRFSIARIRRSRVARWSLELAVLLSVVLAVRAYHARDAARGAAPAFAATDLEGRAMALSDLRGKPAVVHFWAAWCGTCTAMRDNIEAIARRHQVLGVAAQSGDVASVRRFAGEHGITSPTVVDETGALVRAYGVRAFPTSFFLDAGGNVRHVEVGYTTELGLRLRLLWLAFTD